MSRIQQVLQKAEREGTARRTRGVVTGGDTRPIAAAPILVAPDDTLPLQVQLVEPAPRETAPPLEARVAPGARPHPLLVAATAPHSPAAERYRSLRTRIAQVENGSMRRLLMMTSPGRGEGKSVTSLNLGITMAQEFHRRVIIVDADFRRPTVHVLLGLPPGPGLADVLLGGTSLEDALVTIPDYRLTVLPAGLPTQQPTELLGSGPMKNVLEQLRARFDRILLDTPPVTPLADAGVLARLVDGIVLIVRAHQTPKPLVERSLAELEPSKVLGLVLNDAASGDDYAYAYDNGVDDGQRVTRRHRSQADAAMPPRRR